MTRRTLFGAAALVLMGCVSVGLAADGDKKGEKKPGAHGNPFAKALEQLSLTDDQKAKIKPILDELATSAKAAKDAKDKDAGKAAFVAAKDKVLAVLDDGQKTKFNELLAAAKTKKEKAK